jgi:SPP1 gp7 family putative phage head morphogenesis protein
MPNIVDLQHAFFLAPEDAIAFFRSKGFAFSWAWHDVWQEAHAKAFTVAKAMKLDILQDIRNELDNALSKGMTLKTFQENLIPLLQAKGWWGKTDEGAQLGSAHRLETIFRTNVQSAYSAGRYKQQAENADDRPYWQYVAVMDSRTRPEHWELNGKVFRFDDVFWETHYPPNGFRCRCRVRALTGKQIKDRDITVESGAGNMVSEDRRISGDLTRPVAGYKDPATGKITFTDPGWSSNAGKDFWQIDLAKYSQPIQELAKQVQSLNITSFQDAANWIEQNISVKHNDARNHSYSQRC